MGGDVIWYKYNLGAKSSYELGYCFQWADIYGYTYVYAHELTAWDYKYYSWPESYSYYDGMHESEYSKYCQSSSPSIISKNYKKYDAAYVFTNGYANIPSTDDFNYLMKNCDIYRVSDGNGKPGILFKSKVTGQQLVFPSDNNPTWSTMAIINSYDYTDNYYAYCWHFNTNTTVNEISYSDFYPQWCAFPVRPVVDRRKKRE